MLTSSVYFVQLLQKVVVEGPVYALIAPKWLFEAIVPHRARPGVAVIAGPRAAVMLVERTKG